MLVLFIFYFIDILYVFFSSLYEFDSFMLYVIYILFFISINSSFINILCN